MRNDIREPERDVDSGSRKIVSKATNSFRASRSMRNVLETEQVDQLVP